VTANGSVVAGMPAGTRTRTIEWEDPLGLARAGAAMSGIEAMRAIASGELPPPPIAVTLGMEVESVRPGRAVFSLLPQEFHYNPLGVVHGGIAATLLDTVMGCAVQTLQPVGRGYTTLELSVKYVRAITLETGVVIAEGSVVHAGRRVATAEGRVTARDSGKLLAHATTTCLIVDSGDSQEPPSSA
jgi:uncharacterized protein (TIGR00369 family)